MQYKSSIIIIIIIIIIIFNCVTDPVMCKVYHYQYVREDKCKPCLLDLPLITMNYCTTFDVKDHAQLHDIYIEIACQVKSKSKSHW